MTEPDYVAAAFTFTIAGLFAFLEGLWFVREWRRIGRRR